jgi:hypothetical protein
MRKPCTVKCMTSRGPDEGYPAAMAWPAFERAMDAGAAIGRTQKRARIL